MPDGGGIDELRGLLKEHEDNDSRLFGKIFDRLEAQHNDNVRRLEDIRQGQAELKLAHVQLTADVRATAERAITEERLIKHELKDMKNSQQMLAKVVIGDGQDGGIAADVRRLMDERDERRQARKEARGALWAAMASLAAWVGQLVWNWRKP